MPHVVRISILTGDVEISNLHFTYSGDYFFVAYLLETCIFYKLVQFIMPPASEKLRGHIGLGLSIRLSVRQSVTRWQLRNSRTSYARILKLYMWHVHEK